MNRYNKLQNGDIYDNWTKSTICRDYLVEILNRGYKIINHDSNSSSTIDLTGDITFKKAMGAYDDLARNKNSVLD